ncbi:MAG TPA: tubulin-like doman-containing protein [Candidatus Obscuribacterales bacterium]
MAIRTIPSLVVGLGGTGKRALTHLRRRIYDTYGREDLPWIRLLSIDTDSAGVNNPPVISQRTGEYINLGNSEMRIIDQSDTPQVISNLDAPENRHIKDWYPDPDMKVDFPKAARGSGQVRMFGRIGLYKGDNLHTTYRWLQQAAHDVSDPASWEEFPGFEVDQTLQFVYVICSLCGGTGSGMFLDVAYMLRKIVGVDPSTRRFIGMFVMPEVYEPVVENQHIKRIYANAYAALREMDYLLNSPKRSYKIRGKDHTFVDFSGDVTPFDFVFLFSNKNRRGAVISQRQVSGDKPVAVDDRIAQYMSETIITDVLSPLTERSESILSNIFTSISEPEQVEDRTFFKSYSAVGVSSVKMPPVGTFADMIEERVTNSVIDFLLRPDPEVTERALAKQFFADHLGKTEDLLGLKSSLSTDPAYGRFLSRPFFEEFRLNRPACINKLKQWVDLALGTTIDGANALEIEQGAASAYAQALQNVSAQLDLSFKTFADDPERGYVFLDEWLEELISNAKSKLHQVPAVPPIEGDPTRPVNEAMDSLQRVSHDVQLPVLRDTIEVLLERLSDYYDNRGRMLRSHALTVNLYNELIKLFEKWHMKVKVLIENIRQLDAHLGEKFDQRVAELGDMSQERILIDKPLIGRREVEKFLNSLLAPIWQKGEWNVCEPALSDEIKAIIESELSHQLMQIQFDTTTSDQVKKDKIETAVREFVRKKIIPRVFTIDPVSGKYKEPSYTTSDGRSLLLDFAQDNLLSLMVAHSSPLWFVQTHQIGSASQPVTFVGLNGIRLPENLVEQVQKIIPNFRTTDIVLSDAEPRIVVKQYDPLYSLASLASIGDYENYYRNTDRKLNPMHTDHKFVAEPNPYLQWLSYRAPDRVSVKTCDRGHDITGVDSDTQYCPQCSHEGNKTLIVPGKMLCPMCSQVIDKGSRKCPECRGILEGREDKAAQSKTIPPQGQAGEGKKEQNLCPGCVTLGKGEPEVMVAKSTRGGGKTFCPSCGSMWTDLCPYCSTALEKLTMCTKGSDSCIFESPTIVLCSACNCPVTPDMARCPRCLKEIVECPECRAQGKDRRMLPRDWDKCPERHGEKEQITAGVAAS